MQEESKDQLSLKKEETSKTLYPSLIIRDSFKDLLITFQV